MKLNTIESDLNYIWPKKGSHTCTKEPPQILKLSSTHASEWLLLLNEVKITPSFFAVRATANNCESWKQLMHIVRCTVRREYNLTKIWSPQLHLSGHLHVVIKERVHKCNPCFDPISISDLIKESIARSSFSVLSN